MNGRVVRQITETEVEIAALRRQIEESKERIKASKRRILLGTALSLLGRDSVNATPGDGPGICSGHADILAGGRIIARCSVYVDLYADVKTEDAVKAITAELEREGGS
jgi:hypothetical protein